MRFIKGFFHLLFVILSGTLRALWRTLGFLIDLIDGGEETDRHDLSNSKYYNYRTGQIDSYKRPDGLYDETP